MTKSRRLDFRLWKQSKIHKQGKCFTWSNRKGSHREKVEDVVSRGSGERLIHTKQQPLTLVSLCLEEWVKVRTSIQCSNVSRCGWFRLWSHFHTVWGEGRNRENCLLRRDCLHQTVLLRSLSKLRLPVDSQRDREWEFRVFGSRKFYTRRPDGNSIYTHILSFCFRFLTQEVLSQSSPSLLCLCVTSFLALLSFSPVSIKRTARSSSLRFCLHDNWICRTSWLQLLSPFFPHWPDFLWDKEEEKEANLFLQPFRSDVDQGC